MLPRDAPRSPASPVQIPAYPGFWSSTAAARSPLRPPWVPDVWSDRKPFHRPAPPHFLKRLPLFVYLPVPTPPSVAPEQREDVSSGPGPGWLRAPSTCWTIPDHGGCTDNTYDNIPDTSKGHWGHSSSSSTAQSDTVPDRVCHNRLPLPGCSD